MPLTFSVATFVGPACAGVSHRVIVNPSSTAKRHALNAAVAEDIIVFVLVTAGVAHAEFYQAGHVIKRCGSGTVAAAHVLHRRLGLPLKELRTATGTLRLRNAGDHLGYSDAPLSLHRVEDDSFWSAFVDQGALGSFLVGSDDDYVLMELANESAVANAHVDLHALQQRTRRALILTSIAAAEPFHYVLRYFAPQYGLAESAVTASVNTELGCFWSRRLKRSHLLGRQLSPQGAMFEVMMEGKQVWVMGRTKTL